MNSIIPFLRKTWDTWSDRFVRLVAFPLPPTPVGKIIYMPDAFASKVFDVKPQFSHGDDFQPVMIKPSKWGPAILAHVQLKEIIKFDKETGNLLVPRSTLCARTSFYGKTFSDSGIIFATDIVLDGVSTIARSCHPGSHYSIPGAPYLTALLQYAQAPIKGGRRHSVVSTRESYMLLQYSTPEEAHQIYPRWNYKQNEEIDKYLSSCVVNADVSWWNLNGGVGKWAQPYLTQLRRNVFLKEHEREQKIAGRHEVPGNASEENDGSFNRDGTAISQPAATELRE